MDTYQNLGGEMKTVTYTQVEQLVKKLPKSKLPIAYHLLVDLINREVDEQSPQAAFMRLSLEERHQLLSEQAEQMKGHYEQISDEHPDL